MLNITLEELDGQDWGEPNFQSSLVIDCHRLRRVALQDFTDGDLRRMIGQHISLDFLVPLALIRLHADPFAGDWYTGDLINALLSLPEDFWQGHLDLTTARDVVIRKALELLKCQPELKEGVDQNVLQKLQEREVAMTTSKVLQPDGRETTRRNGRRTHLAARAQQSGRHFSSVLVYVSPQRTAHHPWHGGRQYSVLGDFIRGIRRADETVSIL